MRTSAAKAGSRIWFSGTADLSRRAVEAVPFVTEFSVYGLSLVKTWSLEMSLNITKAAKISSTTKAAW